LTAIQPADEAPAAAELRHAVGEAVSQRALALELDVDVLGDGLLLLEAPDDLGLQLGELAALRLQRLLDVARPEAIQAAQADDVIGRPGRVGLPDLVDDRTVHHLPVHHVAVRLRLLADRADERPGLRSRHGGPPPATASASP
jgi:hypothetical protein